MPSDSENQTPAVTSTENTAKSTVESTTTATVKKPSQVSVIFSYIFAVLLTLSAIYYLFTIQNLGALMIVPIILNLALAAFILPPTNAMVAKKVSFKVTGWVAVIVYILCTAISGSIFTNLANAKAKTDSEEIDKILNDFKSDTNKMMSDAKTNSKPDTKSDSSSDSKSSSSSKPATAGKVGQVVETKSLKLTVTKFEDNVIVDNEYLAAPEGSKYIRVTAQIENKSNASVIISDFSSFEIKDDKNVKGETSLADTDSAKLSGSLPKGEKVVGSVLFQVSDTSNKYRLYFKEGYLDEPVIINLN